MIPNFSSFGISSKFFQSFYKIIIIALLSPPIFPKFQNFLHVFQNFYSYFFLLFSLKWQPPAPPEDLYNTPPQNRESFLRSYFLFELLQRPSFNPDVYSLKISWVRIFSLNQKESTLQNLISDWYRCGRKHAPFVVEKSIQIQQQVVELFASFVRVGEDFVRLLRTSAPFTRILWRF